MTDSKPESKAVPSPIEERRCPGEAYAISPAVCQGRQKRNYEKCEGCPFKGPAAAPAMTLTGRRK